jgi:hypothetical protein
VHNRRDDGRPKAMIRFKPKLLASGPKCNNKVMVRRYRWNIGLEPGRSSTASTIPVARLCSDFTADTHRSVKQSVKQSMICSGFVHNNRVDGLLV